MFLRSSRSYPVGEDEIHLEKPKALDNCWTVLDNMPIQCHMEIGDTTFGMAYWDGGSHPEKLRLKCVLLLSGMTMLGLPRKV